MFYHHVNQQIQDHLKQKIIKSKKHITAEKDLGLRCNDVYV